MPRLDGAAPLDRKFQALARRVRLLRTLQGACLVALVLAVTAFAAIVADASWQIPAWVRGCLLGVWLVLAVCGGRRYVLGPLTEPANPVALAAIVEAAFPRLEERLTTAAELADHAEPYNGAPGLIDEVVREAESRSNWVDFRAAVPAGGALIFAAVSLLVLTAILSPLAVVRGSGDQVRRFLLPWYTPASEAPCRIVVTSGNTGVARGEAVTLVAYLTPGRQGAVVPTQANVAIRDSRGAVERVPMRSEQESVFFTRRAAVEEDFDYRVEAGPAESDWFRVTAVDPVGLAEARVRIRPPAYAAAAEGDRTVDGLGELSALQHSLLNFELRFDRTPADAWLEWLPADGAPQGDVSRRLPLQVGAEDRATLSVPALASGSFRLVIEAGHGVRNEFPPQPLAVRPDRPPTFHRVAGVTEQTRSVRPGEPLTVACAVSDDFAVSGVNLEYRIGDGPIQRVPVPLPGAGSPRAVGKRTLNLTDKLAGGETMEYRLAASDNRSVPEAGLGPQVTYYPADGRWAALRPSAQAEPLVEQEITARKSEIDQRLADLIRDVKKERASLAKIHSATARQAGLRQSQADNLAEVRDSVRQTGNRLADLARDAGLTEGLAPVAAGARRVREQQLTPAEEAIRAGENEPSAGPRNRSFDAAEAALEAATEKLQALREANERMAGERLDRRRLERMAEEESVLADAAGRADKSAARDLEPKQAEIEERLRKMLEESDRLRGAVEALTAREAAQLAERLRDLARQQRELAGAMRDADRAERNRRLAGLTRRQREIEAEAEKLARRTLAATRAAQVPPLEPDKARLARESLENDKPQEAVQLQEKAAFELDRLAGHLEGAAALARDPREAARQLARLQDDLQQRLAQETRQAPFDRLPAERRRSFAAEQEAIRQAAEGLSMPPVPAAVGARQQAVDRTSRAAAALSGNGNTKPSEAMAAATSALQQLAEALPPLEKRLGAARQKLAELRSQQEAIGRQVDKALRGFEKQDPDAEATRRDFARRLGDALKQQADLLARVRQLDLPTREARHQRAIQALEGASGDLRAGLIQDAAASQQAARRELERLELALSGQKPPDERLEDFVRRQRELAAVAAQAVIEPARANGLLVRQAELARELSALPLPEAPTLAAEALEKVRRAEASVRDGTDPAGTARRAREAAEELERLAAQVAGLEGEAQQAARLARRQKAAAEEAEKQAKGPVNPVDLLEPRFRVQQTADELRQIRAGTAAQRDKQKAMEALQQALQADRFARSQRQAADALKRFADALAKAEKERPEPIRTAPRLAQVPGPLPSTADAAEARRLALEQRKLRDEVIGATQSMGAPPRPRPDNPIGSLQQTEEEVARKAKALAAGLEARLGADAGPAQQAAGAARATEEVARALRDGLTTPAGDAARTALERLRDLARSLPAADAEAQQAADLARSQEEINGKLSALAADRDAARAQQIARQEQLRQEAERLRQEIAGLAKKAGPLAPDAANRAADAAGSAAGSMEEALGKTREGQRDATARSQERAERSLEEAAAGAAESARQFARAADGATAELGSALERALRSMRQARTELSGGKPSDAEPRMREAAKSLADAGRPRPDASGRPGQAVAGTTSPGANDGSTAGKPDLRSFGPEAAKYAGKPWGELPGELRSRLIQDWKARYGEDYARNIRYYFEQLAERK